MSDDRGRKTPVVFCMATSLGVASLESWPTQRFVAIRTIGLRARFDEPPGRNAARGPRINESA
jgi:hypothetical protein